MNIGAFISQNGADIGAIQAVASGGGGTNTTIIVPTGPALS